MIDRSARDGHGHHRRERTAGGRGHWTHIGAAIALALLLACFPATPLHVNFVDPGAADALEAARHAVAVLHPVGDSDVRGVVTFEALSGRPEAEKGLRVAARVQGLSEGPHAFHVHLLGNCTGERGKTAGTHFNFSGPSREPPPDIDRITGNLGELEPDDRGVALREAEIPDARLHGPFSIIGRSIIVHSRGNDPEKPPIGAAGGRLACGVIGIAEEPRQLAARGGGGGA